jgi:hypothetical protein
MSADGEKLKKGKCNFLQQWLIIHVYILVKDIQKGKEIKMQIIVSPWS